MKTCQFLTITERDITGEKRIKFWTERCLVDRKPRCREVLQVLKSIVQSVTDIKVPYYARETNTKYISRNFYLFRQLHGTRMGTR